MLGRSQQQEGRGQGFPSDSPRCSWAMASTPRTGGPRARAPTWSWARASSRWPPLKTKINVISGLFNKHATGVGIHPGQTGNILSGAALQKGAELKGGISIDQVLASAFGEETPQPSMVLGCEQPITGYHETNFSMAYSSHISWQTRPRRCRWRSIRRWPSTACSTTGAASAQPEHPRPRQGATPRDLSRQVSQCRPGQARRISDQRPRSRKTGRAHARRTRTRPTTGPATAAGRPLTMPRPDNGLPEDIREHMRLMCDIIALAFQTDKTRIATLLLCRDLSGLFYPFLDVRDGAPPGLARRPVRRLRAGHALLRQPARLPGRPARRHARGRQAPCSTTRACCSSRTCGRAAGTTPSKVPVLLWPAAWAARCQPAASSTYTTRGDDNRKLCSLYLSLMDRMGVKLDRFGDATTRLAGL